MTTPELPDDNGTWCDICDEDTGQESHYHCAGCGQVVSMMGHPADVCPSPWEA